jgi:hypothetical protein
MGQPAHAVALAMCAVGHVVLALSWTLGPEAIVPHPPGVSLQFPDSAFALLPGVNYSQDGSLLMFWTDGEGCVALGAGLGPAPTQEH